MIKFGTSGWRAVIADEFTFVAVRKVTQAISNWLKQNPGSSQVVIGHDTRFMAETFAAECARIISANGFEPLLCEGPTPTPTISHAVRSRGAAGAINFTASHNPPEYCGMKFSTPDGAPALPDVTGAIEEEIRKLEGTDFSTATAGAGSITPISPAGDYLKDLASKIDLK